MIVSIFSRFQHRRIEKAHAYVDGTLSRADAAGLIALRVLDVLRSERKGSRAMVVDEDGVTCEAWFWWFQAIRDEMVICEPDAGTENVSEPDPSGDAALSFGNRKRRGVVDRVPRDVMRLYLRDD